MWKMKIVNQRRAAQRMSSAFISPYIFKALKSEVAPRTVPSTESTQSIIHNLHVTDYTDLTTTASR